MKNVKDIFVKFGKGVLVSFWRLHKALVLKNEKLRNIHAGETCLILANGASLKYYDISKLPDFPAIVCSYSLVDRRMRNLNVKYFLVGESYCLYPVLFNTYPQIRRFQKNKIRPIFADLFSRHPYIRIFTNLTNFYSSLCRYKNISYLFHFGDRTSFSNDMAGNFAIAQGALDYMLGVAKYLGFSKAILVGCDYLGSPPVMGHFYADSKPFSWTYNSEYCSRIKSVVGAIGIDVLVILPEGVSSPDFKYDSYEKYFGLERNYRENREFIDSRFLDMMRDAAKSTQMLM